MNDQKDGADKPFYQNIVSQYKRTSKPPKAGKEGSEYRGSRDSGGSADSRSSSDRPAQRDRPSYGDSRGPRSDSRPSGERSYSRNDAPRSDNRAPRPDSRGPNTDSRSFSDRPAQRDRPSYGENRGPRPDSRPSGERSYSRNDAPRSDNRAPRPDSRGPNSDSRNSSDRPPQRDRPSYGDSRGPRFDSRGPRPEGPRPEGRPSYGENRGPRSDSRPSGNRGYPHPDNQINSARDAENSFARSEAAREGVSNTDSRPPMSEGRSAEDIRYPRAQYRSAGDSRAPRKEGRPSGDSRFPRSENRGSSDRSSPRREGRSTGDARYSPSQHLGSADNRPASARDAESSFARSEAARDGESRAPRKPFVTPLELTPVFGDLPAEARKLLEAFPEIVDAVFPLDGKRSLSLSTEIRDLSHELTDERGDRRVGYMNEPAVLSAYIHYYMWWNLIRITRLLVSLPIKLNDGDAAVDLGSGPLTLPIALWMTRPDLRDKKITWYCVDISQGALAAGEELFLSLAARTGNEPWQIIRIKGESGVSLRRKVALVTSANMFNELFWDNPLPLDSQAMHHAEEISSYGEKDSSILVIEPGVPRAGRFISLMRNSLIYLGYTPVSPCPHDGVCPFPGQRNGKWCHFVFETTDAPAKLHKLSDEAGLAKDRAALSFIFAQRKADTLDQATEEAIVDTSATPSQTVSRISGLFPNLKVRITSDPIRLPDFFTGRYGCSELGMVMITGTYQAADYLKTCHSGSLIEVPMPDRKHPERDQKTNAIIIRLK